MITEPTNEELNEIEEVSAEEWNASCDLWDMMHDEYGLADMQSVILAGGAGPSRLLILILNKKKD